VAEAADPKVAPQRAVVASIVAGAQGDVRLILDDVTSRDGAAWTKETLYTSMTYDLNRFTSGSFSEAEYAQIGFAVVARLAAAFALSSPPSERR
jgi:hypothetical protein